MHLTFGFLFLSLLFSGTTCLFLMEELRGEEKARRRGGGVSERVVIVQ
jgi:hypothetical protein